MCVYVPTIGNSHLKSRHHSYSKRNATTCKMCEWKCEKLEYNFATPALLLLSYNFKFCTLNWAIEYVQKIGIFRRFFFFFFFFLLNKNICKWCFFFFRLFLPLIHILKSSCSFLVTTVRQRAFWLQAQVETHYTIWRRHTCAKHYDDERTWLHLHISFAMLDNQRANWKFSNTFLYTHTHIAHPKNEIYI